MPIVKKVGPASVPADATELTIPMRDGVRLAADLYLASSGRPGAVILVRLPYDKDGVYCFMPQISRYFLARGYHVVVQDVRGKYRSEGATEFAVHEVDDGHDTIQWLTEQPWCDGDVVMWGDSYYGHTAIAAAISGHPALRAISPRLTGSQLSMVLEYGDGSRDVEQISRKMYFASHYVDADRYEWEPDWSRRPLRAAFEDFFTEIGERSVNFDAEFAGRSPFVPRPLTALLASPPVPALYTIGWFDNCAIWSWHDVRALSRHPGWSEHLYLRLEAIDHENYRLSDAPIDPWNDHAEDPEALDRLLPRYLDPALEFFDAVLERGGGDLADHPRVRYELCHGEWRTSDRWPPPESSELTLHLSAGPSPSLTAEAPVREASLRWIHDPGDLVPSAGANPFAAVFDRSDLGPVGQREDVVRFLGPALDEPLDLLGTVTLRLSLNAPAAAHVHARLLDVDAGGAAYLITKAQVRLPEEPGPGATVLDLLDVAYRLRAGHRLALDLMSSEFPDYIAEAPAGTDPWTTTPAFPSPRELTVGGGSAACLRIGGRQPDQLRDTRPTVHP
ncbi:CocE/NonD family hydrolase [Actinomadura fulvescens]|uniref:CocE/NonD family hydrolase n=1 Tax=Actinomadura fulvescens TaxID=46160 RepID=A0ABP6CGX8_9ACTN